MPNFEEKHEPVSDIDTAVVVVGLKALDPEWPIREAIDPKRHCACDCSLECRDRPIDVDQCGIRLCDA